ncbi:porin [Oceanisphaera profunda]|uniref:Porin n=1 Tax=Oceanisphaera profunda TaxID=1416627 RepID=A0A1Y0D1L1_9GAMM|nr:porin [Oceanisphaera profunda]ART81410.1 porin [Oceanisphaera profunda]
MKKTILALMIPALFATSASAVTIYSNEGDQVDIYGRIQYEAGAMKFQDGVKANNFGGEGEARLGINAKYNLNQDVDLIGKLEYQVVAEADDATGSDNLNTRYAWAGFRFMDTTDLTFGRSQDPYALVVYDHDIFNVFGARATYGTIVKVAEDYNISGFGIDDKVDDQIRVAYANNGVDLRAAYAFADDDKVDGNTGKKNQWSLAASYTLPMGLGFGAAYEQQNFGDGSVAATSQNIQTNLGQVTILTPGVAGNGDVDFDAWILGVNYVIDGFYIAAAYTEQEAKDDTVKVETKGYELTGTYNVDAWTMLAQYSKEEAEVSGVSGKVDTIDAITLGVQYDLTAKAKLYTEYEINSDDFNRDDRYGVGIQYNF